MLELRCTKCKNNPEILVDVSRPLFGGAITFKFKCTGCGATLSGKITR